MNWLKLKTKSAGAQQSMTGVERRDLARRLLRGVDIGAQTSLLKGAVTRAGGRSGVLDRYDVSGIEPHLTSFSPLQVRAAVSAVTNSINDLNGWTHGVAVKDIHQVLDRAARSLEVQAKGETAALDFARSRNTGVAEHLFAFVTGQLEP
jgi:hypothetical protein